MPAEVYTLQTLSRSFTGDAKLLRNIFRWIQKEFPGPGQNYILVTLHMRSIQFEDVLKLRTAIFPRQTPIGTVEVMPVVFIIDEKK
jgi:hypothetical protein